MMFVLMVHMVEGLVPTILGPPEHVRIALASESTLSFSWSTQVVSVSHERKNPALNNRKVSFPKPSTLLPLKPTYRCTDVLDTCLKVGAGVDLGNISLVFPNPKRVLPSLHTLLLTHPTYR